MIQYCYSLFGINKNPYFFPMIIVLGIITSYTDIKFCVIRNRHLILALIYSLLIYPALFFTGNLPATWRDILINILLATAISLALYLNKKWAPGDAKLFIIYSILIPTTRYSRLFHFPSLALFLNITIFSLIWVIFIETLQALKNPIVLLKRILSKNNLVALLKSIILIFTTTWFIWFLLSKIKSLDGLSKLIIQYLSYFLLYALLKKLKKYKFAVIILLFIGLIARYILQPYIFHAPGELLAYLAMTLYYTFIFMIIRIIFLNPGPLLSHPKKEINQKLDNKKVSFAPFMFLGALFVNSDLIAFLFKLIRGGK